MKPSVLGLIAATALSSFATAASADCFRLSDINGHSIGNKDTLYLSVRRKDVYQLTMKGSCLAGAMRGDPLITESFGGGPICKPIDLNLKIGTSAGPSACIIDKIEKLTPEQIAAIPKKLRP